MTLYRVDGAQVLDAVTYVPLRGLVGQQVQIVLRDTTTPANILDETSTPITGSMLTVNLFVALPRYWISTTTPADLYMDWYDSVSGARGPVLFEKVLRDEAVAARAAAESANGAAQGALSTAQALDAVRMKLAGAAVAQGGTFWGVWSAGNAPVPPNDGGVHWGLEIVA